MSLSSDSTSSRRETIAVVVTYVLEPDSCEKFLGLATAHAQHTLREGRGCSRYDVVRFSASKIVFYEIYDSAAAFEEHASSQYLAEFRERRAPLVRHYETDVGHLVSHTHPLTGPRGE